MSKSERQVIDDQMAKNEIFCANSVICKDKCNNVCPCRDTIIRYAMYKHKWHAFESVDSDNYAVIPADLVVVHIVPAKTVDKSKDAEIVKINNKINVTGNKLQAAKKGLMRSATGKNLLNILNTQQPLSEMPHRKSIVNKLAVITESEQTINALLQQKEELRDSDDSYTGIGTAIKKSFVYTPNMTTVKNQKKISMFSKTSHKSFSITTEPIVEQPSASPDMLKSANLAFNGKTNFILRPYGLQTVIDQPTEKLQTYSFQVLDIDTSKLITNVSCMMYVKITENIPKDVQKRLDKLNGIKRRSSKSMSDIVLIGGNHNKDVIKISVNRIKVALTNAKVSFTKVDMYHQFVKNLHKIPKELLKELCIKNGLDSSGKKAELVKSIRRIVNK